MAATLAFDPAPSSCGHIALTYTLTIDGQSVTRTLHIERSEARRPLTAEDADALALLNARVVLRQVALTNARTALAATTLNLTAVGA